MVNKGWSSKNNPKNIINKMIVYQYLTILNQQQVLKISHICITRIMDKCIPHQILKLMTRITNTILGNGLLARAGHIQVRFICVSTGQGDCLHACSPV
jgi:hypothetical protein